MNAPAIKLPKEATGYVVLGLGAVVAVFALVKWGIPALTKAGANATKTALNQASQLPAAAVTATGNAVGSTLDAIGNEVLGASTYNAIPNTWGGVWSDIKGWFSGGSSSTPSAGVGQGAPSSAPATAASGSQTAGAASDVLGNTDFYAAYGL